MTVSEIVLRMKNIPQKISKHFHNNRVNICVQSCVDVPYLSLVNDY